MKLYLGNAVWRTEEVGHSQAMRSLVRVLDKRGLEFYDGTVVGDALISRARSVIGSRFLRSDKDVLLSIDSDIWFRPEDAISLAEKAMEYDIVAAMYMTRGLENQPALMLPDHPVIFAANAMPVEAPFVSTGFVAVNRKVFQALSEELPLCHRGWSDRGVDTSFWPFYMPYTIPWDDEGHIYLSEDWAFCQRAKDMGFKVWLDPSIRLGHFGQTMFTLEDLIRAPKPDPEPLKLYRNGTGELQTEVLTGGIKNND